MRQDQPEDPHSSIEKQTFPAVRSLLAPDALREDLPRRYPIGHVQECLLLRSLTNDVYAVTAAAGRFILKVYGYGWRTLEEVAWETDLLAHLVAKGVAGAPAIPALSGQPVDAIAAPEGSRPVVLFSHAEGSKPQSPSVSLYRAAGHALAQLHQASDGFRSPHPRRVQVTLVALDEALTLLLPRLIHSPDDHSYLLQLAGRTRDRLTALAAQGMDWGVCHGDVTLDNLHITADGRVVFYDFDSAGPGWRASDPYGVMMWLTRGKPEYWDAFLAGYEELRPLGEADRQALPWFVPLQVLDNLRWHLTDWLSYRGSTALEEGYVESELAALQRWDQDVLGNT